MPFLTQGKTNWKYILIVVILVILVSGGILVYTNYLIKEIISFSRISEIKKPGKIIEDETANWRTYFNENLSFSFKYPTNWIMKEDTLPDIPRETMASEYLYISNDLMSESPGLILYVNPAGFGVIPPDIEYELAPTEENGVKIINRTEIPPFDEEGPTNIDGIVVIFCKTVRLGANTYSFEFVFKEGGKDFEPVFNQMLSTFRFIE